MTPIEVLRERVERGAAFLDEHEPMWWKRVDEKRLRLEECEDCVLGQIYGDYVDGLLELSQRSWRCDWAEVHGFDLGPANPTSGWRDLDALWLEVIAQRKNQGDMA